MNTIFEAILKDPAVKAVAEAFIKQGAEIALVGGVVRDALCGRKSDDFDFTTNLHPDEIIKVLSPLGEIWRAGQSFGTVGVFYRGEKIEVTTYRTETYEENSRKPIVGFGTSITEDLERRDLTINSMALALTMPDGKLRGSLVDLFNGVKDLNAKVLRSPADPMKTISDDPLRSLRAIRFSVLRGMSLDESLRKAITAKASRLKIVAEERKLAELEKLIKSPLHTARALELATGLGVEKHLFGELANAEALGALRLLTGGRSEILMVLGSFVKDARAALHNLRMPTDDARFVHTNLVFVNQMRNQLTASDVRRLLRLTEDGALNVILNVADALFDNDANRSLVEKIRSEEKYVRAPLPVTGHDALDLGLKGKQIRKALERVEDAFCTEGSLTRDEALKLLAA